MRDRTRLLSLATLLGAGLVLVVVLALRRVDTPLRSSLAPAFQLVGEPLKAVNHLVTRVIPIGALDEREFGEVLGASYEAQSDTAAPDFRYVNDVMARLSPYSAKPFRYRAYLLDYEEPNAMALPGGVVLVTKGLLRTLGSEAELASVLAHELGHIEQGHCLDAVKFRLLAEKIGSASLGEIADFAVGVLVSHSYSKTQEDEADEYAYAALVRSQYDPRGVGWAFSSLLAYEDSLGDRESPRADPIRDYFWSHPPLALREAKFRERAEAWWQGHRNEHREVGAQNLRDRVSVFRRRADP
jgi:beta-barrel assembly-enhancing protease